MFAIMFAGMLMFLGLVFDGGRLYYEKRRMQAAADAASRGAAFEILRGNTGYIDEAGKDDSALNGFVDGQNTATVTINNPPSGASAFSGNNSCAEAIIRQDFPTTLMRIAAGPTATVAARATACVQVDNTPPVLVVAVLWPKQVGLAN